MEVRSQKEVGVAGASSQRKDIRAKIFMFDSDNFLKRDWVFLDIAFLTGSFLEDL